MCFRIFFDVGQIFFWRWSKCFMRGSKIVLVRVKLYEKQVCLESSLNVDYLKVAWKFEGLSQNCTKIQKTFIKQNVFSRTAFLENRGPLY